MLDRAHRLTRGDDFTTAVRRGRRAGTRSVVVHLWTPSSDDVVPTPARPPRVGFVVGKAVGDAVRRNRVKRRLRHLVRDELGGLPDEAVVVVRALPAAADASHDELGDDLRRALRRAGDRSREAR